MRRVCFCGYDLRGGRIQDKTGREITIGCVVDVFVSDILAAYVTEVRDGGLAGADGKTEPALLVLQIAIPMKLNAGEPAPVYIIRASDKPAKGRLN